MHRRGHRALLVSLSAAFVVSGVAWLVLPGEASQLGDPDSAASAPRQGSGAPGVPGGTSAVEPAGPPGPVIWERTSPNPDIASADQDGEFPRATALGVSIPSIGVSSEFVPLGIDPATGVLIPPASYDVAGLFSEGPVPGEVGPAIIAGHVDSRAGPGVFYRLEEMAVGDVISVSMSGGVQLDFQVLAVAQYPKDAFPTDQVYGPTPERELRLITCGGTFDSSRRSYRDNIVVYAVLI